MHVIVIYVLAVSGLLALVSFLPPLAARLRVPYTVLLAAVGVALGVVIQSFTGGEGAGPFHDFLNSLAELDISSEVLIYVFLPVLLFETALAVDVRRLFDDVWPILLLAVVAVFVCTFAVGYALSLFTSMGLVACLLLGSIVATTDPAAVVSIFRDLGAPRRLTMLVEGESLLNDAAAIALFTLLLGMLTRNTHGGAADAAVEFLRDFAGGVLTGYVCGRVVCMIVEPVRDQPMAEITLTVALAYLSYVLAEHYVGASGVVAVVTAALVVGSVGRTRISPATWGALEHVWRQLGFWANSLIFLMTALLVPRLLGGIGWTDVGLVLVVVAAAMVSRALVLFGLLPLLSGAGLGQRVSHAYKTVMLWGGLRGAVSLTLALAVTENARVPDRVQGFVAVLVTGFVFYTLFVNGTTLRAVINLLGLNKLSPVEHAMRNRALALSLTGVRERVEGLAHRYEVDEQAVGSTVSQYTDRLDAIVREQANEAPLSNEDRVTIGLVILVNREEELYYEHFKEGILSRGVAELLDHRTGRLLDAVKAQGRAGYRAFEEPFISFTPWMRVASFLHRRLGIHAPLARRLAIRFEILLGVRTVQRELLEFINDKVGQVLGTDVACELEGILTVRLAMVEQALAALKLQYPDYALLLQSRYVSRAALRLEEADYRTLFAESIISQEILSDLERDLHARRHALDALPKLDLRLDLMELVGRVPLFRGLEDDRVRGIATLLKPRLVLPGETIVRRGERGDAMFFIASGAVEVLVPGRDEPVQLGTGDVFGEMALLTRQRRNADVRAMGYCQLLVLDVRDFHRLVKRDASLRAHLQAVAEARRNPPQPKPVEEAVTPVVETPAPDVQTADIQAADVQAQEVQTQEVQTQEVQAPTTEGTQARG